MTNAPPSWPAFRPLPWILQGLAAAAFGAAGLAKLAGAEQMVALFEAIGIGQWFRYVTGAVEISGSLLLLVPGLASRGAVLLAATMIGAVLTHLFVIGGSPAPALVLLSICIAILWLRRSELPFDNRTGSDPLRN